MNARARFWLAVTVLGLLMTGPFWLTAIILWADLKPDERAVLYPMLLPRLPIGAMLTAAAFVAGVAVLRNLFKQYVQGLLRMAETLRLMLAANRNFRVQPEGPPEVRQLAEAANELAQQRDLLLTDVEAQIKQAKGAVEEEKNRLAALVADLPQPIMVCNLDGRILLYNHRARLQAKALAPNALVGLGRSIYAVFDRSLIAHALETLQSRLERQGSQPLAHFVTPTHAGQLIRVQMAPVLAANDDATARARAAIGGYVLTLENISHYLDGDNDCDLMMMELAQDSQVAIAGIRSAVRDLSTALPAGTAALGQIESAVARLTKQIDAVNRSYAESARTRWPLEEMLAADLLTAVQRRIEVKTGIAVKADGIEGNLWVKVDSYSLVMAMSYLAARLAEDYNVRLVRLRAAGAGRMVHFDMLWTGTSISNEVLMGWQLDAMSVAGETSPLTLRDVTDRHGGEISCGRESATQQSLFRLLIPVAAAQEVEAPPLVQVESRPEFYDFNLFRRNDENHALDDRPLSELVYSAFDTETTGLEPANGDEIIQFGAVRIVNGRLLRHESFDQLVDPRRPLRPEGIPIHGITEDMVAGQPPIDTVLPQFHRFCEDTVLVAHNAAFDMRFLQLKEARTGIRFTQPLLDTLLLSAVVHPNQESHKLEAIAERMGIRIIGRHTALGDAIVTGEVFLRLLTLLADMGIHTLGQARAAAEKTYYARIEY